MTERDGGVREPGRVRAIDGRRGLGPDDLQNLPLRGFERALDGRGEPVAEIEPAEIIMLLAIRVHRADPQELSATIAQYKHHRKLTEPSQRHAGTVFKDPPGEEASQLIDQVGLKGKTHGKAQISERNANYIVNRGGAQAADIAALIKEAHRHVLEQLGVNLELDVELRGEWEV